MPRVLLEGMALVPSMDWVPKVLLEDMDWVLRYLHKATLEFLLKITIYTINI